MMRARLGGVKTFTAKTARPRGDAARAPGLHLFERAHEHFVEAKRIGSVLRNHVVGIDDVAARLRHLERTTFDDDGRIVFEDELVSFLLHHRRVR